MSDDAAEKIAEASPDKKRRARKKGDVPISQEANTAAAFAGFLVALAVVAPFADDLATELRAFFLRPEPAAAALLGGPLTERLILAGVFFLLPLVVFPAAAVLLSLAVQQGIVFAPNRIKPDINKINPVKGAGKKFGPQALLEFSKNSLKIAVLSAGGAAILWMEVRRIGAAFTAPAQAIPGLLLRELIVFFGLGVAVAALFALIDIPLVRAQREKRLKMSRQEQQDETKESEGDPALKAQRRRRAEKIAMSRMISEVKEADVLITNPTHYAVGLKWDRSGKELPVCIAKGADELALRLRAAAEEAGVPVREDPPCARALHATIEIGDPITSEHFKAVAAAIRFADRVRALKR
ncbi:EscU/YscU/HrcU family type III secretion system export apparatus switch protein [Parvularcula lutaonensis]|uniref:Flagellar biosynthesis protein FlhB n=1 Tax=Parvularcula lutaonensis TaxID=491923 RepID=A0ABV7M8W3_9PROT|nr:flagellar type III secretion system protein FlhB [Parvularcula lutaonensis]GGY43833.1 flagellar biosynthesis protein FlhB [Parvularcula lutaonensis]